MSQKKVLVLHGPNLNLLGSREPEIYGSDTLDDINASLKVIASGHSWTIEFFQSNHEGALIDRIHEARGNTDYIIINPGALTHTSYALRDAIAAVEIMTIEVHLSNLHAREVFRRKSVIAPVCRGQVIGFGAGGYGMALQRLIQEATA